MCDEIRNFSNRPITSLNPSSYVACDPHSGIPSSSYLLQTWIRIDYAISCSMKTTPFLRPSSENGESRPRTPQQCLHETRRASLIKRVPGLKDLQRVAHLLCLGSRGPIACRPHFIPTPDKTLGCHATPCRGLALVPPGWSCGHTQ